MFPIINFEVAPPKVNPQGLGKKCNCSNHRLDKVLTTATMSSALVLGLGYSLKVLLLYSLKQQVQDQLALWNSLARHDAMSPGQKNQVDFHSSACTQFGPY